MKSSGLEDGVGTDALKIDALSKCGYRNMQSFSQVHFVHYIASPSLSNSVHN